jgi:hypothetical protein
MRPDQHHAGPEDPDDTPLGRALSAYPGGDPALGEHLPAVQHALVLEVGPVLAALRPPAPIADAPAGPVTPSRADDPIAVALGLVVDPDQPLAAHPLGVARPPPRRLGFRSAS